MENSSTGSDYFPPKNAVDENESTFVFTKTEKNPQLTIILSKIFNIKSIYVCIYAGKKYQIDLKHFFKISDFFFKLIYRKIDAFIEKLCNIDFNGNPNFLRIIDFFLIFFFTIYANLLYVWFYLFFAFVVVNVHRFLFGWLIF